jgi:phosphoribosylaminoimidazole-succinocarboxamide synthase
MALPGTIETTDFDLPGQIAEPYHGKVADVYTLEHEVGTLAVTIRTDRISAYNVILPQAIPFKGQAQNSLSSFMLKNSDPSVPNWHIASPDPNVTIGHWAEPIRV